MKAKLLVFGLAMMAAQLASGECVNGVWEGPWAGPSPEPPSCQALTPAPDTLCFPAGCSPVAYEWSDTFRLAKSALPNGYPTMGWSGPCVSGDCPEIDQQAFESLFWNARQANRAQRFESE